MHKAGLIISLIGAGTSVVLKDWSAVCLWLVIILQDFQIKQLEEHINEK